MQVFTGIKHTVNIIMAVQSYPVHIVVCVDYVRIVVRPPTVGIAVDAVLIDPDIALPFPHDIPRGSPVEAVCAVTEFFCHFPADKNVDIIDKLLYLIPVRHIYVFK